MTTTGASNRIRVILALSVAAASLGVSLSSLERNRQLGARLWGDEFFLLGGNLKAYRTLGLGRDPIVFRPPGYPLFVAAALAGLAGEPAGPASTDVGAWWNFQGTDPRASGYDECGPRAVYRAQSLLLAGATALLFLWLSLRLEPSVAAAAALMFGINPYAIILTGVLKYEILHWFLVIGGCYLLELALDARRARSAKLAAVGAWWGLATLVRPVTLILPPFALMIFLLQERFRYRSALKAAVFFSLGMALPIAPWAARNYALTGRFIPVNAQAWENLYASTIQPWPRDPNHFNWLSVLKSSQRRALFARVTGIDAVPRSERAGRSRSAENYRCSTHFNIPLEDAFKEEALRNIRASPWTYVQNGLGAFWSMNAHINSVLIKVFQHIQDPKAEIVGHSFAPGVPQDFHSSGASDAFGAFAGVLALLAGGGVWLSAARRDAFALVPGFVHLCICVAHSITWMDMLYYYAKVPFLFFFATYLLNAAPLASVPGTRGLLSWRALMLGALTAVCLSLTAWTLWA